MGGYTVRMSRYFHFGFALLWVLATAALAGGCASTLDRDYDRQVGLEVAKQLVAAHGVIEDQAANDYVSAVGQRLIDRLPARQFDYRFFILDEAMPNAFALPGGYVFVTRGMFVLVGDEAELAGLIAHEIVHVEERHSVRQAQASVVPGILTLPTNVAGGVIGGKVGGLVRLPGDTLRAVASSRYSQSQEHEADRFGQQLMAAAGYDPSGLGRLLQRIEAVEQIQSGGVERTHFLSTHPTNPARIERLRAQAAELSSGTRAPIKSQSQLMSQLDGVVVGPHPRQGVFRDGLFLHPDLGFVMSFPDGWQQVNAATAVGAMPADRNAALLLTASSLSDNPIEAARKFREAMEQELPGAHINRDEPVMIHGNGGHTVQASLPTRDDVVYMDVYWLRVGGATYQLVSASGTAAHRDAALASINSLRDMTRRQRASITARRMRVVTALPGETIGQLSQRTGNVWSTQYTAAVNSVSPLTTLREGEPIKIARTERY